VKQCGSQQNRKYSYAEFWRKKEIMSLHRPPSIAVQPPTSGLAFNPLALLTGLKRPPQFPTNDDSRPNVVFSPSGNPSSPTMSFFLHPPPPPPPSPTIPPSPPVPLSAPSFPSQNFPLLPPRFPVSPLSSQPLSSGPPSASQTPSFPPFSPSLNPPSPSFSPPPPFPPPSFTSSSPTQVPTPRPAPTPPSHPTATPSNQQNLPPVSSLERIFLA
jgi:hypothetical protein